MIIVVVRMSIDVMTVTIIVITVGGRSGLGWVPG